MKIMIFCEILKYLDLSLRYNLIIGLKLYPMTLESGKRKWKKGLTVLKLYDKINCNRQRLRLFNPAPGTQL